MFYFGQPVKITKGILAGRLGVVRSYPRNSALIVPPEDDVTNLGNPYAPHDVYWVHIHANDVGAIQGVWVSEQCLEA